MRFRALCTVLAVVVLVLGLPASVRVQVQLAVLHTFSGADGDQPYGGLVQAKDGELYGVTLYGGANNLGTVFRIGPSGFKLLHEFSGQSGDGANPMHGRLVEDAKGDLYGTTELGGAHGSGTVFKLTTGPAPKLTIIHAFEGGSGQGHGPYGGVILGSDGALYGTTYGGGDFSLGTVFRIQTDGSSFQTLHSFDGPEGAVPYCALIEASDGLLYGTTTQDGPDGNGTIFRIQLDGADFKTVYAFKPVGAGTVLANDGVVEGPGPDRDLYGVTLTGGSAVPPHGSVFRVAKDGSGFQTLHSFTEGDPGGYWPAGQLLQASDGNFYGTTAWGVTCAGVPECGGLFSITPTGVFTPIYEFTGLGDGASPLGGLTQDSGGAVYGATAEGTVFTLLPPAPPPPPTPALELTGTGLASAGSNASYTLTLKNLTAAEIAGPFTVTIEPSPGLTFGSENGAWSCSPDPGDPTLRARVCSWSGPLPAGATSPDQEMTFGVDAAGPYASDCGTGPTPCVSVRASLAGTTEAKTLYTQVVGGGAGYPPQAHDHELWAYESSVTFNPLFNAYDPDGDAMTVALDTQPARGMVAIEPDGLLTYTPFGPSRDPDSFRYRVWDARGASATAIVRINSVQPTLASRKTLIDVGPVALGRLASGWSQVDSNAFGLAVETVFENPTQAEIDSALAGTPYESLGAVPDIEAFRFWPGGRKGGWEFNRLAYGPNWTQDIVFRPSAGRVSVTKVVYTSYYTTGSYPGEAKATTSAIVVGMSSPPGVTPVTTGDDIVSTPVDTPVTIQFGTNDTSTFGRTLRLSGISASTSLEAELFDGVYSLTEGSISGYTWDSTQATFTPKPGFVGTTSWTYSVWEDPCPWQTPCSYDYNRYFGTVTVNVGVPGGAPTPVGTGVTVQPTDSAGHPQPISLTFSEVTTAGVTTAEPLPSLPSLPAEFKAAGTAYDITTTAQFTPPIRICLSGSFGPSDWILHYEGGQWVQLPNQERLPAGGPPFGTLCADTDTLSPFIAATRVNRPPSADAGASQTVEATSAAGALVTLTGSGSDPDGDPVSLTWSGPCGGAASAVATLACPIGSSTMTLTATDSAGLSATSTVIITVRDTTPPAVTPPATITVAATEAGGARGSASATLAAFLAGGAAADLVDPSPVRLAPQAGGADAELTTLFPMGTTAVTFRFRDAAGNIGDAAATVTVLPPAPALTTRAAGRQVQLNWASVNGATSYTVYRGSTAGGPYVQRALVPATQLIYLERNLTVGATYYWVVRAVGEGGNESGPSNETMARIIGR